MQNLAKRIHSHYRRSRFMLYGLALPVLAYSLAGVASSVSRLAYVILGFSLIIFLHELGHFVVARACSVRCEAFSLGIGPRMFGWRKGRGITFGAESNVIDTTAKEIVESAIEGDIQQTGVTFKEKTNRLSDVEKKLGETDYRVSWLPLGGYVRMLGQDDMDPTKVSNDPHAFNRRPIWQRMCIVSAGVIMNLIFAAVAFSLIFSPSIGVDFPPAQLGQVVYNGAAWNAGLRMGDRIIAIDGDKPAGSFLEFTDVMIACALSSGHDKIKFDYIPYGETATKSVDILPVESAATGFLAIGAESMIGTKVNGSGEEYAKDKTPTRNTLELSKIRDGDEIVGIDGENVRDNYMKIYQHVQAKNGQPVALTLENSKNKTLPPLTITLTPQLEPRLGVDGFPPILGIAPRVTLGKPAHWSAAAAADLREGDAVLQVGDRTSPTDEQFRSIIAANPGRPLDIVIERSGVTKTIQATPKLVKGKGQLGIPLIEDAKNLSFNVVGQGGPAEGLNLPTSAAIAAIDGVKVDNWLDVYGELRNKSAGVPIPVTFTTDKGTVTKPLTLSADESQSLHTLMQYELGMQLTYRTDTQRAENAAGAVVMGMEHTKKFILQVYMTLAGLFRGTVSPSNLHGIVGITKVGYDAQERGPVWLWYILALVSVNLAVANFLPLPIVDGGLFLLLILEKIRGKPLSLKVQSAIQVVGLVILAGLFLFVTINDISLF